MATASVGQSRNSLKYSPPNVSASAPDAVTIAASMQKVTTKVKKLLRNALLM